MKSIEIEVAELRKRNAVLVAGKRFLADCTTCSHQTDQSRLGAEAAASQEVIRQLRETLASKNVSLPVDCTGQTRDHEPTGNLASCSMGKTSFPNQRLEVQYPSHDSLAGVAAHPATLDDNPNAVVNFVLSLEQPCIYHHRLPSPELLITGSIGGTGHSSMLSSIVMDRAPDFSFNPLTFGYPPDASWQTPTVELEQLLATSQQLGLDDEVTPIQVWNLVRQHAKFGACTTEHLEGLRSRLGTFVKCYGSVVDFFVCVVRD